MRRPCIGCGNLIPSGSRCSNCTYRNGSTRAHRQRRQNVLARAGHECAECGGPATHADHIIPLIRGGADAEWNMQALCEFHNLSKGGGPVHHGRP